MFVTGRQKVFAHSSGLKDFYVLKHVASFHFVRVILLFGFKLKTKIFFVKIEVCGKTVQFSNISENTKESLINFLD